MHALKRERFFNGIIIFKVRYVTRLIFIPYRFRIKVCSGSRAWTWNVIFLKIVSARSVVENGRQYYSDVSMLIGIYIIEISFDLLDITFSDLNALIRLYCRIRT